MRKDLSIERTAAYDKVTSFTFFYDCTFGQFLLNRIDATMTSY
jgi:hypothetical protein